MRPRKRARLQLCSFAFLFFLASIYLLSGIWSNNEDATSEKRRDFVHLAVPNPGIKPTTFAFKRKLTESIRDVFEGIRSPKPTNKPINFAFSKETANNVKAKRHGIQAPVLKELLDRSEKAPQGLKKKAFSKNNPSARSGVNDSRGFSNGVRESDESYRKNSLKLSFDGEDERLHDTLLNQKNRNISQSDLKFTGQGINRPLLRSGGMLPLIDQSELDIAFYKNIDPLIPHIIHQTWDTYEVPEMFIPWIKSVVSKNPEWVYLFWTQDDVQCYFRNRHPDFLQLYNSYLSTIFKTDVMRYFLLYDIGGFYLDLDVECLKPLDIWSHYAHCVLSHETYEHVFLIQDRNVEAPNVMTTVLASRPKHPYFKMLQDNLVRYRDIYRADVLRATGPYFMQEILDLYLKSNYSLGKIENQITVLNPAYWLPTFDPILKAKIEHRCTNRQRYLKQFAKDLCKNQALQNYKNQPSAQAYLNHFWVHTNLKPLSFKMVNLVDIRDILPNLVKVTGYLDLKC